MLRRFFEKSSSFAARRNCVLIESVSDLLRACTHFRELRRRTRLLTDACAGFQEAGRRCLTSLETPATVFTIALTGLGGSTKKQDFCSTSQQASEFEPKATTCYFGHVLRSTDSRQCATSTPFSRRLCGSLETCKRMQTSWVTSASVSTAATTCRGAATKKCTSAGPLQQTSESKSTTFFFGRCVGRTNARLPPTFTAFALMPWAGAQRHAGVGRRAW